MISGLGDWIFLIAMPLYIFDITKSTIATGSMFIIQMLPRLYLVLSRVHSLTNEIKNGL